MKATQQNNTMRLTITTRNRGCGTHTTIVEEPYASALATIDGLASASDNATYRGVRFGRQRQRELVIYFRPHLWCDIEEWRALNTAGIGTLDVPQDKLDAILAASAAIDAEVEMVSAIPKVRTYACAGSRDGCRAMVTAPGEYCARCAHDA